MNLVQQRVEYPGKRESNHSVESDRTTVGLDSPSKISGWSIGQCSVESQLSVTPAAAVLFGRSTPDRERRENWS